MSLLQAEGVQTLLQNKKRLIIYGVLVLVVAAVLARGLFCKEEKEYASLPERLVAEGIADYQFQDVLNYISKVAMVSVMRRNTEAYPCGDFIPLPQKLREMKCDVIFSGKESNIVVKGIDTDAMEQMRRILPNVTVAKRTLHFAF